MAKMRVFSGSLQRRKRSAASRILARLASGFSRSSEKSGILNQAVDRDDVGLAAPEKDRGFLAGNGADRGEGVGLARGGAFHGPFGRDVLRGGLGGGIDAAQIAVNVAAGSGQGAAQHGGVGGEDRAHSRANFSRVSRPRRSSIRGRGPRNGRQRAVPGFHGWLPDHLAAGHGGHDRLECSPSRQRKVIHRSFSTFRTAADCWSIAGKNPPEWPPEPPRSMFHGQAAPDPQLLQRANAADRICSSVFFRSRHSVAGKGGK